MQASVIIPTRNRPRSLARCLLALAKQDTNRDFEVIVVDDGSSPRLGPDDVSACPGARVVWSGGVGPARARNRGLAEATAPLILFTDDDTAPSAGWLDAACGHLESKAGHVGVEGPVVSPAFDPLYERSLQNDAPGAYWTCNIAYTRDALLRLGGFAELFPVAHGEDLDLAFRALRLGSIGFSRNMVVTHYPSAVTVRAELRRARDVTSTLALYRRHPERYRTRIPFALLPAVSRLRSARAMLRTESAAMIGTPRRLARFCITDLGTVAIALIAPLVDGPVDQA